jgi:hypothetical protein
MSLPPVTRVTITMYTTMEGDQPIVESFEDILEVELVGTGILLIYLCYLSDDGVTPTRRVFAAYKQWENFLVQTMPEVEAAGSINAPNILAFVPRNNSPHIKPTPPTPPPEGRPL